MNTEWDLARYFYSGLNDENIQGDIKKFSEKNERFIEKYKDRIAGLDENEFLEFLEESDVLNEELTKVYFYLGFKSSLDTQDQDVQKEMSKVNKFYEGFAERLLFVDEELKKIGFKKLNELSTTDKFRFYKNDLIKTANDLKYLLSEPEEKVYLKLSSSTSLYDNLTSSFEFKMNGEPMTESAVLALREDKNPKIRKQAFQASADVYQIKQNQIVLGHIYSTVCKANVADIELRGFQGVMTQRNKSEELSDETVETLLKVTEDNYSLYHDFLKAKAKFLGLEKLETSDVFAPFPSEKEQTKITFEQGWQLYKDVIENVDPKLAVFSEEMLTESRLSVYPKPGKTGGAYANYTKNFPEFVLLNWTDTFGDVTTLAHELGHAFHGRLSQIQTAAVYHTPLTLAETASIFNETLMFESLLETITDETEKKKMIWNRLDDIFGTIFRQVMYVNFEKQAHESFLRNEPLTYDDYNTMWVEQVKKLYGDAVNVDEELIKHGWSSISHIFESPFYCYTYAFGNIISLNLYQSYKAAENKEEFLNKYHALLAAGGSDTPENLLNDIFGLKFDENFYEVAFSNIKELIKKLEE